MSERLGAMADQEEIKLSQEQSEQSQETAENQERPGDDEAVEAKATGSDVRDDVAKLLESSDSCLRDPGYDQMLERRAQRNQSDRYEATEIPPERPPIDWL